MQIYLETWRHRLTRHLRKRPNINTHLKLMETVINAPVPLPRVKSPPWSMKFGITRWKTEPLNHSGLVVVPFSPVHRALQKIIRSYYKPCLICFLWIVWTVYRKFSTVLGVTSARKVNSILPAGDPPIDISKKTTGFAISPQLLTKDFTKK